MSCLFFMKHNFQLVLKEIKVEVIKSLYNLFIALGVYTLLTYLISFTKETSEINIRVIFFFIITLFATLIFIYIRLKLNTINYKIAQYIFIAFFSIISILYALNYGTYSMLTAPLIILVTLPPIIIISVKFSQKLFIFILVVLLIISALHVSGILKINTIQSGSDFEDLLILLILVWVIFSVAKAGYSQIERSYSEAMIYSNELIKLNRTLDKQVKDRTQKLQENYDIQIQSIYDNSVLGSISKNLIHDISTPISSLRGSLELMQAGSSHEFLSISIESAEAIENIIRESRELMQGRDIEEVLDVQENINKVLKMLKAQFMAKRIEVNYADNTEEKLIKGNKGLFSRIIINILVNAAEELSILDKKRIIDIYCESDDSYIYIVIKDNGRGIPEEEVEKIFDAGFSLKTNGYNLGLGLSFVKKTIIEKFNGKIKINSVQDKETRITLVLKKHKNASESK